MVDLLRRYERQPSTKEINTLRGLLADNFE